MGISKIRHVKLPVSDVPASAQWYQAVFQLGLRYEFVEQDELRGVSLVSPDNSFQIALRDRRYCASQPQLTGFDVVAFGIDDRADLDELAARCDRLGAVRTPITEAGGFGTGMDITDPDGTVLRIICESPDAPQGFLGVVAGADGSSLYHQPRLNLGMTHMDGPA